MSRAAVLSRPAATAGVLLLSGVVAAGVALSPWMTSGIVLGGAILAVCLLQPLLMLQVMLFLGLVDLSLLTGGWKSLFVQAGGLDMNGLRLIGATAGFAAVALAHGPTRRALIGRLGRGYVLFLLFAAATVPLSWSAVDGARLWFKLVYPFLVFLLVLTLPTRREELERLMDTALAGAAAIALVLNPLLLLFGAYTVTEQGQLRMTELSAHQTVAAPYFVLMITMALTRYATRRQVRYLLLALVCAFWVIVALSRMAFAEALAVLLILGITGAIAVRNFRLVAGTAAAVGLLSAFLLPAVLERSLGYVPRPEEFLGLLANPVALMQHVDMQGRDLFWPLVTRMFLEHPLMGSGLGSTRAMLSAAVVNGAGDVHNEYLRLSASTGLIGVALLTSGLVAWWVRAVRLVRRDERLVREYAFPAVAAVAALALDCFSANTFDYYTQITQYVFFLLAGAMAAARLAGPVTAAPGPAAHSE